MNPCDSMTQRVSNKSVTVQGNVCRKMVSMGVVGGMEEMGNSLKISIRSEMDHRGKLGCESMNDP